jgi:hypothetical protein
MTGDRSQPISGETETDLREDLRAHRPHRRQIIELNFGGDRENEKRQKRDKKEE